MNITLIQVITLVAGGVLKKVIMALDVNIKAKVSNGLKRVQSK